MEAAATAKATAERKIELKEEQVRLLERFSPEFRERHIEAPHTGSLVAVDTFFVGALKGVGKVYLQTVIDCHNRTVRHEWLGQYLFADIKEVQDTATEWLWTYNHERPNMALGGITPAQKLKRQVKTQLTA